MLFSNKLTRISAFTLRRPFAVTILLKLQWDNLCLCSGKKMCIYVACLSMSALQCFCILDTQCMPMALPVKHCIREKNKVYI